MSLLFGEYMKRLWLEENGDDMMMGWICSEQALR
jgi:hypothetical protein